MIKKRERERERRKEREKDPAHPTNANIIHTHTHRASSMQLFKLIINSISSSLWLGSISLFHWWRGTIDFPTRLQSLQKVTNKIRRPVSYSPSIQSAEEMTANRSRMRDDRQRRAKRRAKRRPQRAARHRNETSRSQVNIPVGNKTRTDKTAILILLYFIFVFPPSLQ